MSLPNLAIRRPVLTTVVFLIMTLLGAVSFMRLPVDLMPDIEFPQLTVQTSYAGVGPQEIEELITVPLERTLSSTPGVQEVTSTSSEGSSQIRLAFEWGTDLDAAADEVRTRVERTRGQLPPDASAPSVLKFDVNSRPIVFLGISGDMEPRELREFAQRELQYRFERLPGVAQADIWGGLQRQIHIELDRAKMHALRISPATVIAAIRRENLNEPAGQVVEGNFELLMRTEGEFTSLEEIRRTMVARRDGAIIYVGDIADVQDSHQEVRNYVRIDDMPGLRMAIQRQSGANTVAVAREIRSEVDRMNRDFPDVGITIISDASIFIERAIGNVRNAALFGSLLAVFVLLLFLRNVRSTLVIAISIPISIIATFALMYFYGFTLNTITFGGLALGVGILVDNAIVVLENIFRHRQEGKNAKSAAQTGTSEVATAITASTLTTVVVFLPVVFMSGMSGILFQQLAWVVSFALFSSLLIALTLVPMLSSRLVRVTELSPKSWNYGFLRTTDGWLRQLDESYARTIAWALDHKAAVVSGTAVLLVGCLLLAPFIGVELEPETDEGEVQININLPEGARLDVTDAVARQVEEIVHANVPEAMNVLTEVGSPGGWRTANTNTVSIRVTLTAQAERDRSSQQIAAALRQPLDRIPGVVARVRSSSGMRFARGGGGGGERLSLDVRGYNTAETYELALELRRLMESTPGISDASVSRTVGRPENHIRIDRERAASMGLSVSDIAATIRTSIGGTTAGYFREVGDEYELVVRFREQDRLSSEDVMAIPVQTPAGQVVPLESVVSVNRAEGAVSINRKDQQRVVTVSGNLGGDRDISSVVRDLQQEMRSLSVPSGVAVTFTGEWEEQQEAFNMLLIAMALAVVLVYLVMAAQFESFKYPFLIMFSLPLASIGVVLILFLTKTTFNIQAFIGAIMLIGIVVNNAIVLVSYVLQLWREHGLSLKDSLVTGGRRRLRPILMTTLTTSLALVPMAIGFGEGSELQAPMARVLIGGLLSSGLITLFLIPTLFLTLETVTVRRREEQTAPREAEPAIG